jgi:hypothetical protein
MYQGRGSRFAYVRWLRDMEMDLVERAHVSPEVAAAVVGKIDRSGTPEQINRIRMSRLPRDER